MQFLVAYLRWSSILPERLLKINRDVCLVLSYSFNYSNFHDFFLLPLRMCVKYICVCFTECSVYVLPLI